MRLPFVECPLDRASNWAWGRGLWGVQCPSFAKTIGPTSRTLTHTHALDALSVVNFTLGSYECPDSSYRRSSVTLGPFLNQCSWNLVYNLSFQIHSSTAGVNLLFHSISINVGKLSVLWGDGRWSVWGDAFGGFHYERPSNICWHYFKSNHHVTHMCYCDLLQTSQTDKLEKK